MAWVEKVKGKAVIRVDQISVVKDDEAEKALKDCQYKEIQFHGPNNAYRNDKCLAPRNPEEKILRRDFAGKSYCCWTDCPLLSKEYLKGEDAIRQNAYEVLVMVETDTKDYIKCLQKEKQLDKIKKIEEELAEINEQKQGLEDMPIDYSGIPDGHLKELLKEAGRL